MTASTTTALRPRHAGVALGILLTAPFLAQVDATIANVATPAIGTGLRAPDAAVQLVIAGYLIAYAALLITGARLGRTFGYRRLFLVGSTAFALASLGAGLASEVSVLVSMRVLQGAAAAMMYPQALTGIQLLFTGAGRARAIGMFAMALAAGAVVGQILGGVLVSADIAGLGWRSIFLVNVPLCLAMIVAAVRFVPPGNPRKTGRPDLAGVVTLTISVLLLVAPLTLGRDQGWPPWTWISLAAFPFACWLFLRTQYHATRHGRAPLVAVDLVRRDPIALALLALLIATGTYYALLFTAAQYFQHGLGRSALASGLLLLPWVAAFGLAGQVVRWVPARPRSVLPSIGYLVLVVVYVAIAVAMLTGPVGDPALLVLFGLGGLGLGIGFAALIRHLTEQVPAAYGADISEVATTTLQLGGAIGIAMFGSVYLVFADATDARHAFGTTNAALAVAAIIATMAAYIATRSRRVATVS